MKFIKFPIFFREIQITPEMYRQFWSLQKFMSNPNLIYEKDKFVNFKTVCYLFFIDFFYLKIPGFISSFKSDDSQ